MEGSQQQEYKIPENVAGLLDPISTNSPPGKDATVEEEYFKLDMEIGKVNPDYKICIDLATEILRKKSKDLRVASWLCFAWYRNEKVATLNNGLILLLELLKKYGNKLFPANPVHRSKALQFLNSGRFVKLLEMEAIDRENAQPINEIDIIFQQLISESKNQFPDTVPELKDITQVITDHAEAAKKFLVKAAPKDVAEAEEETKKTPPEKIIKETEPKEKAAVPEALLSVRDFDVTSEKDAMAAFKKALKFFFQQEKEDSKKHEAYLYGISRSLIWGQFVMPPNENSVTQVTSPDPAIQNTYQEWLATQEWDKLIPSIESNFLNKDSGFQFWLTAQRYLTIALEKKGGIATRAAEEVKFQLARLIIRFPSLSKLKFENNTPFADEDTLKWIEEEVKINLSSGKGEDIILPPILGEDYEPINKEYQKACGELPKNFEKNMENMQQGISVETRRKGRFLRTLNLANFCIKAKQYDLAKVHLSNKLKKIEAYQLTEWEPALCCAVWESAYLVNLKLLESEQDQERISFLEKQQNDLFSKIGNYDGVLALKLANLNKKKGD